MTCECGKDRAFEECCGRLLAGQTTARTCEELVRSRFVAFGLGNFDYIDDTQIDRLPDEVRQGLRPEWESLEILECTDGQQDDQTGQVEFVAYYRHHGRRVHHEISQFVKVEGEWRYKDGEIADHPAEPEDEDMVAAANRQCPCGSGRKYRRCCGV